MALIVQKYGGTSVGSIERIQAVAQRIQKTVQNQNQVVVVVSAMGKTTDGLVKLAQEISSNPSRREMDMLLSTGEQVSIALMSMALQELGQPAISLTGAQVGIVTEKAHSRARILEIKTDRIERHLEEGKVVVIAGFQGISNGLELEITTLGRGGSDTSAVALAAAIKASKCEIYTDVPGILTTDPRLVPEAQLMTEITTNEMLELASLGAKVLHPRAVEIAQNYGIPLVVLSSWSDAPGTLVRSPIPQPRSLQNLELSKAVDGLELDTNQAQIALLRIPDRPGIAAKLFGEIARQNVDVDLIIQSIHEGNSNDIAFTVTQKMVTPTTAIAEAIAPTLGSPSQESDNTEVMVKADIAKLSITGAGMIGQPGIAAQMFGTLAEHNINIIMISTSEVKVSCLIKKEDSDKAINALSKLFEVNCSRILGDNGSINPENLPPVRGVALDRSPARIAIRHVPDLPGVAAKIFTCLAKEKISVDTIIQSQRCRLINGLPTRDIAFIVARGDAEGVKAALEAEISQWETTEVLVDTNVAKISIVGSGMVDHPGVAAKMFAALADHKINIQMIASSEIKVSCVIGEEHALSAVKIIHEAFGLSQPQNAANVGP